MDIYVGTSKPTRLVIALEEFDNAESRTHLDNDSIVAANETLHKVLKKGVNFANDGQRNNDAVNSCIALHVLGFDPECWFDAFFDDPYISTFFYDVDIEKFKEHVERIAPYVSSWGPKGQEHLALGYLLN